MAVLTKVGGSGKSKVGGSGKSKVNTDPQTLFEWHAESTTVTSGTPAGSSVGDTTATANAAVSLSATQAYDGTKSLKVSGVNDYYVFDWAATPAILNPNAGTIDFQIYFTTIGSQTVMDFTVDANNRIWITIDTGGYLVLHHTAGGAANTARTNVSILSTGAWLRAKARWDTTPHSGLFLSITCNSTNGEGNSNENGTSALGAFAGSVGTVKFGDTNGATGVFYLDAIYVYNAWIVSTEVYYVDPSFGGTPDGSTTNPYVSTNLAASGSCNKRFINPIQIKCRTSGSTSDTTRVDLGALGQMVTSASCYLEIMADTGHAASAKWDATKYNLYPAYGVQAGTALNTDKNYIRITNLQIGISTQTNTAEIVYWSGLDLRMSGCLVRGTNSSAQITRNMSISTAASTVSIWNCVFYANGTNTGGATACLQNHGATKVYSSTFIGAGWIDINNASDGTLLLKNSYFGGASFGCIVDEGSSAVTLVTCATSDSTGSLGLRTKAVSTANFVNVTIGSEDYHLPIGSALLATGTDTSADTTPLNFTIDIDRAARVAPWTVGATIDATT